MEGTPIIEMKGIVKVYPDGTKALKGVDLTVNKGEILGLLGENGAGKTTLMKILFGMLHPTSGKIFINGEEVRFKSPSDAIAHGIGMVHQHFTLVEVFDALHNIILGMEGHGAFSKIDVDRAREKLQALMDDLNFQVPLDIPVEDLPVGVQQRIEILKMLYRNVDVLILDEPTAVLTPLEVEELFRVLRQLKAEGKTIIFISHKLNEVMELTDRVTVIRKGEVIGTVNTSEATPQLLARMMVGRDVVLRIEKPPKEAGEPILKVENLTVMGDRGETAVKNLSFEVRAGEIFGIAGVEGNGQTELIEAISGLRKVGGGKIYLNGKDITGKTPRELYDLGMAHIPEDRTHMGLILEMTVTENSVLGLHWHPKFQRFRGIINWNKARQHAQALIEQFDISAPGTEAPVKSLSGGNQQKLIVAREVSKEPVFIIAAQPTRGVDVASTEYIRNYLVKLRNEGKAVLLVSADLDEVIQLSDRMGIIYEGEFMGVVKPEEVTTEEIGMMMGGIRYEEIRK
ncbi:ABC transporter ATP-binding protein [Thermococcus siculi]|uniref:ABC transporter ATP-binding protein n=1 Tax=Thermococcus siculi TaxID=72803 RepID=A0A2Z2MTM8_9EURY|nr:ABC transporter ATP-binding protein [Thermococcus siculi]ASJ09116.1 ABC transporter ATP-binding protein [Thermococcus siculi]